MSMNKSVTVAVERICKHFGLEQSEVEAVVTAKKAKETKTKTMEKPKTLIPFLGKVEGWCDGLKLSHGLFNQCTNKPMATGSLCKTCQKQADSNESGKPNCGLASDRVNQENLWRDPKNRAAVAYGNLFNKLKLDRVAVVEEISRIYKLSDSEISDELFETVKTVRGRPKKTVNPIVSDTDSEGEPAKKQRGRPKKNAKPVVEKVQPGEDLISTLVAQAQAASESEASDAEEVSSSSETETEAVQEPKKVKKTKLSAEEKEAAKATKEAEKLKKAEEKKAAKEAEKLKKAEEKKAAKEAEKEAAKAAKEAEKLKKAEEKKAAKEAEKEAAKAAKEAEKEAAKAAKEAEKLKKAEEKKAAKKAKKVEEKEAKVEENTMVESVELEAEAVDEAVVEKKMIGGVEYLVDEDNTVYDLLTQEPIGMYIEEEDRIEECEFEEPELVRSE